MECGAKDPTGYLAVLHLSIICLGNFNHATRERNRFPFRQSSVIPPDIVRGAESTGQSVDCRHCGVEWESREIDPKRKNGVVVSVEIFKDARSRVHDGEIVESIEEASGGNCSKLFQALHDHHPVATDIDATDEHVETV